MSLSRHELKARKVKFDLSSSPIHWLPDDVFSSHLINGIHMLLPAGELWFCRVYNKALPYINDPELYKEVKGFIHQEGSHAQAHKHGEVWLRDNGFDTQAYLSRVNWLFETLLNDQPLKKSWLMPKKLEKHWLILRVGIIAAIEHFTGLLGDWCMNSTSWDDGDPVIADLFRWHLAEEVEHRTVAFDLYEHLCDSESGFYVSRQAIMALVFPLFVYFLADAGRSLAAQDQHPDGTRLGRASVLRMVLELEKAGRHSDNVPTFSFLLERTLRWIAPSFHPISEGDTQQALDYIARSPAAQAIG